MELKVGDGVCIDNGKHFGRVVFANDEKVTIYQGSIARDFKFKTHKVELVWRRSHKVHSPREYDKGWYIWIEHFPSGGDLHTFPDKELAEDSYKLWSAA